MGSTQPTQLELDLAEVINRHSLESGSDTPDFALAIFLKNCLIAYNRAVFSREAYHNRETRTGDEIFIKKDVPLTEIEVIKYHQQKESFYP